MSHRNPEAKIPSPKEVGRGCKVVFHQNKELGACGKIVAVLTMGALIASLIAVPFVILWLLFETVFLRSAVHATILAVLVFSSVYPRHIRYWPDFCSCAVFTLWRSFFGFFIISEIDHLPDSGRRFILGEFPHGLFPISPVLSQTLICCLPRFSSRPIYGAVADAVTWLPLWRHVFGWLGASSASRGNIVKLLGESHVCIFPGGVAEMGLKDTDEKEHIFLAHRKGFIKLAIQTGADLIPSYHLGNTRVLRQFHSELLTRVSRAMRFALFLIKPWIYRERLIQIIGLPIHVEKNPNPTQQDVDRLHALFSAELVRLFDDYKHLVGWQGRRLVIV